MDGEFGIPRHAATGVGIVGGVRAEFRAHRIFKDVVRDGLKRTPKALSKREA